MKRSFTEAARRVQLGLIKNGKETMARSCRVRVVVPHYFGRDLATEGYGSTRGDKLGRAIALARCISAILSLARSEEDDILDIASSSISRATELIYPTPRLHGISIDCHVFVTTGSSG